MKKTIILSILTALSLNALSSLLDHKNSEISILKNSEIPKFQIVETDFDVYPERKIYKVNEKVVFKFLGNAQEISYYTGEQGSMNQFRNVSTTGPVKVNMNFQTMLKGEVNKTSLKVLSSTSFNGFNDEGTIDANVLTAANKKTWKDITSRFNIPSESADKYINSNGADISDLAEKGEPVVFAFRFEDKGNQEAPVSYIIKNLNIENITSTGKKTNLLNFNMRSFWVPVDVKNPVSKWSKFSSMPAISILGSSVESEDWIISAPINLNEIKPDKPERVKTALDKMPVEVSRVYGKPGIYTVSFIYKETDTSKEVLKEFQITVIP